ncbi:hypothetical protein JDV02_008178 [Purpureocillium takamizusanense]|uniref:Integral membrane protein n=1 Tax=Purpureocillium takamizusanense TaxID=2060973 RepID=A0A9Q8QP17_9HYPO|nr:uncharacterized protein JDV02_008178 [Purpureocillium takamizusanense]UNI22276.1 hypothetical protein JDV02_008178 [Purpureocillium takamizusanense]
MSSIDLAVLYFGLFLGIFPFTLVKVADQTRKILVRSRGLYNAYLYMIWIEALVNLIFALITFLYLKGIIPGSYTFYAGTVLLWAIQTQLLSQIIANRVALIMVHKHKARWLKLGLLVSVACINIAVAVIWIRAHAFTATPFDVKLNDRFEKAEKAFFLVIDLGLNLLFLYLVRFRLIASGLSKYWRLFKFNIGMVTLSTSMDMLLLGFLSLPDPYLYVQFSPVAYIVKLYIELTMATLIAKIVRSSTNDRVVGFNNQSSGAYRKSHGHYTTFPGPGSNSGTLAEGDDRNFGHEVEINKGSSGSDIHLSPYSGDDGILKTVTTVVVTEHDKEQGSTTSGPSDREHPRDMC